MHMGNACERLEGEWRGSIKRNTAQEIKRSTCIWARGVGGGILPASVLSPPASVAFAPSSPWSRLISSALLPVWTRPRSFRSFFSSGTFMEL